MKKALLVATLNGVRGSQAYMRFGALYIFIFDRIKIDPLLQILVFKQSATLTNGKHENVSLRYYNLSLRCKED